jgi:hypothetical protein
MLPPAMCISNSLTLGFPFGYMATKMVTRVGVALRGTEACNRVVGRESYARERERERERERSRVSDCVQAMTHELAPASRITLGRWMISCQSPLEGTTGNARRARSGKGDDAGVQAR